MYYAVHVKTKPPLQVISFAVHNFFNVFGVMREILIEKNYMGIESFFIYLSAIFFPDIKHLS